MGVVELQVDDVLDPGAVAVKLAALAALDGPGGAGVGAGDAAGCDCRERERNRDRACDLQAFAHALLLLDDRETLRLSDPKCESDIWQSCVGVETASRSRYGRTKPMRSYICSSIGSDSVRAFSAPL